MPSRLLCAVAVAAGVVLAGCSSGPPAPTGSAASSTGAAPSGPGDADAGIDPGPGAAVPTWTDVDAAATRRLALDAMAAFAAPGLSAQAWFEQLAGYLTGPAQAAFYGTDPAQVPVHAVGDATVASPSAYLAEAAVGTDAGTYRVLMVREGAGRPWKVERIEPAA